MDAFSKSLLNLPPISQEEAWRRIAAALGPGCTLRRKTGGDFLSSTEWSLVRTIPTESVVTTITLSHGAILQVPPERVDDMENGMLWFMVAVAERAAKMPATAPPEVCRLLPPPPRAGT